MQGNVFCSGTVCVCVYVCVRVCVSVVRGVNPADVRVPHIHVRLDSLFAPQREVFSVCVPVVDDPDQSPHYRTRHEDPETRERRRVPV